MEEAVMSSHKIVAEQYAIHDDSGVIFKQPYDPDMPDAYREYIKVSPEIFAELGKPGTITITIESGDKLNDTAE